MIDDFLNEAFAFLSPRTQRVIVGALVLFVGALIAAYLYWG